MGLLPLEFTDGLTDSPYFRETLQAHERELDLTNTAIKHLIKDIKDLIAAARCLSRAQRTLSETLNNFNFECIGNSQTDDEMVISNSFKDFARLLSTIEDERDRLLEKADEAFLDPIERFRREQIGSAKEAKKKFDKETNKYCQNLERYLNLSVKKSENHLVEADVNNSMEQHHFFKAMSEYVLMLQEVNERKKFEFVETVLSFMLGWLTFYHQGHEIATDFYSVKMELQIRLQKTRNNFNMTQEETKSLRQKMLNNQEKFQQKFQDSCSFNKMYTRQGYLFLMEKKAFSTSWSKHFCKYDKNTKQLTKIQYTQTVGKILDTEEINVKECIKRNQDSIDRRFCFDIVTCQDDKISSTLNSGAIVNGLSSKNSSNDRASNPVNTNENIIYTFQALSEEDYKNWLEVLEARDPHPTISVGNKLSKINDVPNKSSSGLVETNQTNLNDSYVLDDEGYCFVKKCIRAIEDRGLEQKGIYRVVGVTSKIRSLMEQFVEHRNQSKANHSKLTTSSSDSSIENHSNNHHENEAEINQKENNEEIELLSNLNLDSEDFETKTLTSSLKNYLRNLSEPIMTFQLHKAFIAAAKLENKSSRIEKIHMLVHRLPALNFKVLKALIEHLQRVSQLHDKNLMTSSNLGVCFGPTLLRTAEESVAAIMDIKFVNVIAELLIENYEKFFLTKPTATDYEVTDSNQPFYASNFQKLNSFNQIQQRPLPSVPTISSTASYMTVPGYHTQLSYSSIPNCQPILPNQVLRPADSYVVNRLTSTTNPSSFRRSNSQDQLYSSVVPATTFNRVLNRSVYPANGQAISLHPQHSSQYLSNYVSFAQALPNSASQKKSFQYTSSSVPVSVGGVGGLNHNVNQQNQMLYNSRSQLAPYGSVSMPSASNSIYGVRNVQLPHHAMLQPSMSFQNLNYSVEPFSMTNAMVDASSGVNLNHKSQVTSMNHIYNRPTTSIGIIPQNSNYGTIQRIDGTMDTLVNNKSNDFNNKTIYNNSGLQSSANNNFRSTSNPSSILSASRNYNIVPSSSPSNSLPSTPEHSQMQFPFKFLPPLSTKQHPVSPVLNPSSPVIVDGSNTTLTETAYSSCLYPTVTNNQQQQSIYGTILSQQQQPNRAALAQPPPQTLPSSKVRTRYVCIGGSQSELSFQPNMVITNVRKSREPGWLEGNLNGKTGLIPLNYVEFIE